MLRLVEAYQVAGARLELSLAAGLRDRARAAREPAQGVADGTLGRELRSAKTGKEQVVALREFADSVGLTLARIDALAPPPAMVPWHDDQRAKLAKSRARRARARPTRSRSATLPRWKMR
jgi:hypothetical protein